MMIKEERAQGWREVNLSSHRARYPQPRDPGEHLPRNYIGCLSVGATGSGKTFAIVQLIKQMENAGVYDKDGNRVEIRTILIAPSADANPVYKTLSSISEDDIHLEYSDGLITEIKEDIKREREATEEYQEKMKLYKKLLKMKHEDDLTMEELFQLDQMNWQPPVPPRYPFGVITNLILDDLLGSDAFKSVGKSIVNNLWIQRRHFGINMYIATQNYKSIPKPIRTNANVIFLFRYGNSKVLAEDIYPELSRVLKDEKQFIELFEHATSQNPRDFLLVDLTKPASKTFRRGWDNYLVYG
jgi:hypothetical protein